jgi:hypothetical protein
MQAPAKFSNKEDLLIDTAAVWCGIRENAVFENVPGITVLLKACDQSPRLTREGADFVWAIIVRATAARMLALKGIRENPESQSKQIRRPIVITGLPRCGTTALHKLMSVDPQFQGIQHWLAEFPSVRPPRDHWMNNPHYKAMANQIASKHKERPDLKKMHLDAAEEVDECFLILHQSFVYQTYGESLQIPMYDEWWMAQDEAKIAYPWYSKVIRLIGARDDRTWLLKNPGHMWCLDGLFNTYPDAQIIQMHRRIDLAFPSFFSLIKEVRGFVEGDNVDIPAIVKRDLRIWSEGLRRLTLYRERRPEPFLDIAHEDFNADPIGTMHMVYKRFNLTLTDEVEAAMRQRIAANPEREHGQHRYTLEMFGLTPQMLEKACTEYLNRNPRYAPR